MENPGAERVAVEDQATFGWCLSRGCKRTARWVGRPGCRSFCAGAVDQNLVARVAQECRVGAEQEVAEQRAQEQATTVGDRPHHQWDRSVKEQ